ncbi:MAG: PilZ domain-containing protein [Pseudomonadota bacterium]
MLFRGDYSEKRDFMRMEVECPMTFRVQGESQLHQGTAKDLSASGLLVLGQVEVPEGTMLEVDVRPEQAIVPPLQATCEVMRVSSTVPGRFELGVRIVQIAPAKPDQT